MMRPGIMNLQDFAGLMPTPNLGPGPLGGGSGGTTLPSDVMIMPPMGMGAGFDQLG